MPLLRRRAAVPALRGRGGGAARLVAVALGMTFAAQAGGLVVAARPAASAEPGVYAIDPPLDIVVVPKGRRLPQPAAIRIPRIGVASRLVRLGIDSDGALAVPADYARAGWYAAGARPGERGPAVVVGHVDSTRGPAVFYRLRELRPRDLIEVERADGEVVRFAVTSVRTVRKSQFPTRDVYGPTTGPALRLVTCGGRFDRRNRTYLENVVVFAEAAPRPPQGQS